MAEERIKVSGYMRRRSRKKEPEDGTGMEMPSIAPDHGVKIIDAKKPENQRSIARGVKRVGGGDHGTTDKGVTRLGPWSH